MDTTILNQSYTCYALVRVESTQDDFDSIHLLGNTFNHNDNYRICRWVQFISISWKFHFTKCFLLGRQFDNSHSFATWSKDKTALNDCLHPFAVHLWLNLCFVLFTGDGSCIPGQRKYFLFLINSRLRIKFWGTNFTIRETFPFKCSIMIQVHWQCRVMCITKWVIFNLLIFKCCVKAAL